MIRAGLRVCGFVLDDADKKTTIFHSVEPRARSHQTFGQRKDTVAMQKQKEVNVQPLLLNIEQAMQVLALGKTKIYELIEKEGLPVMHIGKSVRFSYSALQQWIEQRAQQEVA